MVVHTCNPSTQEVGQEDCEFKSSLDYIVRLHLKKEKKKEERERGREKEYGKKNSDFAS
jgi:hypothetical protein